MDGLKWQDYKKHIQETICQQEMCTADFELPQGQNIQECLLELKLINLPSLILCSFQDHLI
jgi:hypothetical protein